MPSFFFYQFCVADIPVSLAGRMESGDIEEKGKNTEQGKETKLRGESKTKRNRMEGQGEEKRRKLIKRIDAKGREI